MTVRRRVAAAATAVAAMTACARRDPPPPSRADAAPSVAVAPAPSSVDGGTEALPPLVDHVWLESLDLPGGDVALVSVPLGATEPRPVMIGVHGAGDRPEWACGGWRAVTNAWPFIVCPRGAAIPGDPAGRRRWTSAAAIARVVDLALPAVRARYGRWVAEGPMVYAGFSQGAILGATVVRDRGAEFPFVMMSEGGYDGLADPVFAARFAKGGGRRALLGCSHTGCSAAFARARTSLTRAGVEVRVNDAGPVGHNLNGEVMRSLQRDWPWLVRDAAGWPR